MFPHVGTRAVGTRQAPTSSRQRAQKTKARTCYCAVAATGPIKTVQAWAKARRGAVHGLTIQPTEIPQWALECRPYALPRQPPTDFHPDHA